MFKKYMHVEKWGNTEVEGIELGKCYVFPKLDGTNASLWAKFPQILGMERLVVEGGSRNRTLSFDNDNAGFLTWVYSEDHDFYERVVNFFETHPNLRLYGEWLVPHTLKTYREDAWNKFYIFDVLNDETDQLLSYEIYKPILDSFGLDYIPPLAVVKNAGYNNFIHTLSQNVLYIRDGQGVGEGIVIKNYDFYNRFGNQVWAKIVTSEFKEKHHKEMGAPEREGRLVEESIADEYVSQALVEKVVARIENETGGWSSKYIPRLLETVFYDLIREEIWEFIKKNKHPTINFKTLKHFTIGKVKTLKPELF
jgi:hypothetical protein